MADNKNQNSKGDKIKELVIYLFFGVLTTVVCWCTYGLFSNLFEPMNIEIAFGSFSTTLGVVLSNALSILIAMVFAFFTNKVWVFRSKSFAFDVLKKEVPLFFSARLITAIIEFLGVPLLSGTGFDGWVLSIPLVKWFKIDIFLGNVDGAVSKIAVSVIIVILNYIFSKLIIFKKTTDE